MVLFRCGYSRPLLDCLSDSQGLTGDVAAYLDERLQFWTGGAPRLLLYTLRALHHNHSIDVSTRDGLDATLDAAYKVLSSITPVANELFMDPSKDPGLAEAWVHLMVLAALQVPVTRDTMIRAGRISYSIDKLLGLLNVYVSRRPGATTQDNLTFCLHAVGLVLRYTREKFVDFRVPLLVGDPSFVPGLSPAQLLERLVEQRLIVHACLSPDGARWADVVPLLRGSKWGSERVVLDRGSPIVSMPQVHSGEQTPVRLHDSESEILARARIPPSTLDTALQIMRSGRIYRPRPASSSADTFVKQTRFLLEIQDKSGVAAGLGLSEVLSEVAKSVRGQAVLLLFVALKLKDNLARMVQHGATKESGAPVLVLGPGVYQEAKGGGVLFRRLEEHRWAKLLVRGEWQGASPDAAGKHTVLTVPSDLEFVIPSTAAVRDFLGDADFEIVRSLAAGESSSPDVPFLSRFYGFGSGLTCLSV